jgi:hypothetical protein
MASAEQDGTAAPQEKRLYRDAAWQRVRRDASRRGSVTFVPFPILPLHPNPAQPTGCAARMDALFANLALLCSLCYYSAAVW